MAQSTATVTTPSPTPPTNFGSTGVTGPNPPNYTKNSYANMFNLTTRNTPELALDARPQSPYGVNQSPPPYYDDGSAGTLTSFATNVAALAGGTSTTSGGTEGTYPGTGTPPFNPNMVGAVPASTSVAHEGAGTEVLMTKSAGTATDYGVDPKKYGVNVLAPVPLVTVGTGPALTAAIITAGPNASHPSSLSPATNPTLTSIASIASGGGNGTCTATGTNFTPQSVLNVNGISYPTTYTSPTTISCTAPKKATAGTLPVYVVTGGVVQTATVNWTFT
jgi:hypothetical protein